MTQSPSVYADLTVEQNLRYFATLVGAGRDDVERVLGEVDLADRRDSVVDRLSGGQRSRVSLAAAWSGRRACWCWTSRPSASTRCCAATCGSCSRRLAAAGTSLLVSSHVMDEATRCDRLVLMRSGDVLADDTLENLLARTGTTDAEHAFLALVDDAAAGEVA